MGEVLKPRDRRLDRIVALKASKSAFSERFEHQARAMAALNHEPSTYIRWHGHNSTGVNRMPILALNTFSQEGALTETELDRLADFMRNSKGGQAMNIEEFDGFFAALIAGPEVVLPSEYLPEVFGGEMSDTCEFAGFDEANDILGLMMRHWNGIAATLHKGNVHLPILLEDDNGVWQGNDWSRGFMRGVDMRSAAWAELLADEEQCGWMLPVLMLYHEHDEDPELRPGPIGPEKREELIVLMAAVIVRAYRYFRAHQQRAASA